MGNKKIRYIVIAIVVIILGITIIGKFKKEDEEPKQEKEMTSLWDMTIDEQKEFAKDLTIAVVENSFSNIKSKTYLLDTQCYYDLTKYGFSSGIADGNISEITVDYIDAENSSTKDTVIFCNTKVWFENKSYNLVYTFEYHINSDGYIYGYNIWAH